MAGSSDFRTNLNKPQFWWEDSDVSDPRTPPPCILSTETTNLKAPQPHVGASATRARLQPEADSEQPAASALAAKLAGVLVVCSCPRLTGSKLELRVSRNPGVATVVLQCTFATCLPTHSIITLFRWAGSSPRSSSKVAPLDLAVAVNAFTSPDGHPVVVRMESSLSPRASGASWGMGGLDWARGVGLKAPHAPGTVAAHVDIRATACSVCYTVGMLVTGMVVGSIGPSVGPLSQAIGEAEDSSLFSWVWIARGLGFLVGVFTAARVMGRYPALGECEQSTQLVSHTIRCCVVRSAFGLVLITYLRCTCFVSVKGPALASHASIAGHMVFLARSSTTFFAFRPTKASSLWFWGLAPGIPSASA